MQVSDAQLSPCMTTRLLADEIRHLQHRLERLEHGMEDFYASNGGQLSSVVVTALQEIDMLAQSTDALAAYVEQVAACLDNDNRIDLTRYLMAIPLREMRYRLAGGVQEDLRANAPELF